MAPKFGKNIFVVVHLASSALSLVSSAAHMIDWPIGHIPFCAQLIERAKLNIQLRSQLSTTAKKTSYETSFMIGCIICTPISRPIKGTETNALLKNNEQPRVILASFDLQANLFMKRRDSTSTKLNILGVKQQVNEVKKVNFHVHFKKSLLKRPKTFEQKCKQHVATADSCPTA